MPQNILFINTNIARPPVSPVGLEYVAQALTDFGFPVQALDLPFEPNWITSLHRELKEQEPLFIGLSVRNTDDCSFASRKSFIPWISDVVFELRKLTEAPILLGGVGFSTMPEIVLKATQADGGIYGDGEEAILSLAKSLATDKDFTHLPNMVYWHNGDVVCNSRDDVDLRYLPTPHRRIFDNKKYEQLGGMVGIETKRGCSQSCIFCADPVAKGRRVRLRPPEIVLQEFLDLASQDVSWFHLCDSEFNLPLEHAKDICQAIISMGLGDRIRWYCYCSPTPFDQELAALMKRAGCAGINFGVDSLCDKQLYRLGKVHSSHDVGQLVHLLRREGLNFMFDLLIGGPGETEETIRESIGKAREFDVPLVGIAFGVRIYDGTPLAKDIANGSIKKGVQPEIAQTPHQPVFYLSPLIDSDISTFIQQIVGNDSRFLILSAPAEKQSYNYADDKVLCRLIEQGARGAYWDIIRKNQRD